MKDNNYLKKELYELIKTDESIFDFIQESSLDGLWYWDLEQPEEEWMNPKFWAVLGYDHHEMPHKASAWRDIIHPEDLKLASEKIAKHFENPSKPYDQTIRYTHKNGSTVWIRCRGLAIRDVNGKPKRMLGAHHDITELKNSEFLLQKKTTLLRNAQMVGKLGSWELDLMSSEVIWSEELYNIYGFDPAFPPPPYTEHKKLYAPESWERLASSVALALKKGISYELELETIRKDGSHCWMWVRGEVKRNEQHEITGIVGVAQDITDRKNIELEKEALTKRLNYALDASGDGIWDWTPANGRTVFSKAWVEMLGYEVGELASLASEWADRLHPDDGEWVFAAIDKVTQTPDNGDTFSHEYRFRNKAGAYLWILNKAKVVERNEKGQASRVVGTHTNITEQKKNALKIRESEQHKSAILQSLGDLFFVLDTDLTFLEIHNPVKEDLYLTPENFIGRKFDKIGFPEPAFGIIQTALKDCLKKNSFSQASYYLDLEFGRQWFDAKVSNLKNSLGVTTGLVCMVRNVSEDVKKEVEIAAISKEIKDITNAVNESSAVSMTDAQGVFLKVNKRFCELSGYTEAELIGKNQSIINGDYHDKAFWQNQWETISSGKVWKGEIKKRAKNGQEYWVSSIVQPIYNDSGEIEKYLSIRQDITERKLAELELKKTKDFLAQTNQVAQVGGWDFNIVSGEISWSDVICDIHELPHGFVPTFEQMASYYTPESWIKLDKAIKQAFSDGTFYDIELQIITAKGKLTWVRAIGSNEFQDGKCIRLFGVLQNINEKKIAELEKKDSELRLSLATKAGGVGVWDFDIVNDTLTWDDQMLALYGIERKEFSGAFGAWINFVHKADRARFKKEIDLSIEGKTEFNTEFRIQTPLHQIRSIRALATVIKNEEGHIIGMIGTNWDISKEKEDLRQIEEAKQNLQSVFDGMDDVIWAVEAGTFKMIFVTPSVVNLYGYTIEEWYANPKLWSDVITDEYKDIVPEMFKDLEKQGFSEREYKIKTKSGVLKCVKNRVKSVVNNGVIARFEGKVIDITKEKEALKQLEVARKQAESANKAKSEFLASMSHEIRTPLNGVIGFTDLLKNTPLSAVQQQYVNSANISGHTLLGIINDILDFSKIEAGMLELEFIKTDVLELLENSIDIVKFAAEAKGLELLLDIDPALPRFANIDPVRFKQILANLLGNAVKFTEKGEVELKVDFEQRGGGEGKLSVAVRDTGIGISEDQKSKLFKSFSQADSSTTRKFGGTGLGLIISQTIAEKMGSTIHIDSTPTKGTIFYFDFTTRFEEGQNLDVTRLSQIKRCLIIDDNANNGLILKKMLKNWQIDSKFCNNGLKALQKIESSKRYDVIICDYDLPHMNGIETIRMIKDTMKLSSENLPVILLHSSIDNQQLDQKCEALGIRFRLNKPIYKKDLFQYLCDLHQQEIRRVPQLALEKESISGEKIKIIIAEDVTLNMILTKAMLSDLIPDLEIYEAKNGIEAIEHYKKIGADLLFMDIHMPELDGVEATKKIRALEVNKGNHLPIIALTAGALKEEKERCLASGMDDFLTKPLESQKIQSVLKKYLRREKVTPVSLKYSDAEGEAHFGYDKLLKNIGNDSELIQELISMSIIEIPNKIQQIEKALNDMNSLKIKSNAHSIKGIALSMRCPILTIIAEKMEIDAMNNMLENIGTLLIDIKGEWQIVKDLLMQRKA